MENFQPLSNTKQMFTDEDIETFIKNVTTTGETRKAHFGSDFCEADFLCGAMTMFYTLGIENKIPMMWTLGIMHGMGPFKTHITQPMHDAIVDLITIATDDLDNGILHQDYTDDIQRVQQWLERVTIIEIPDDTDND